MSLSPRRNVLVMQSGGPTPVMNRSLFGVVSEAQKAGHFGQIYGADHGLDGALSGKLIELGRQVRDRFEEARQNSRGRAGFIAPQAEDRGRSRHLRRSG